MLIGKLERQKGWKSINLEFCEEYSGWQAHIFHGSWGVLWKLSSKPLIGSELNLDQLFMASTGTF